MNTQRPLVTELRFRRNPTPESAHPEDARLRRWLGAVLAAGGSPGGGPEREFYSDASNLGEGAISIGFKFPPQVVRQALLSQLEAFPN